MRHLNLAIIHKLALLSLLAIGGLTLSACSSPDEDAKVREEPTQHIDAQAPVEQSAINSTDSPNSSDDVAIATADDANMAHDDVAVAIDEGHVDVGTQNNPEVLDGTDEVEHVSTY